MARPRKPTDLLELNGAFKKDPARGRARENEPEPGEPIGDAPSSFTANQKEAWSELKLQASWLTVADCWVVTLACKLKSKLDEGALGVGEMSIFLQCMSRMGLTPADRSRVSVPKQTKKSNPFAEIAGEIEGAKPN